MESMPPVTEALWVLRFAEAELFLEENEYFANIKNFPLTFCSDIVILLSSFCKGGDYATQISDEKSISF